jgi:ribonuclease E
VPAKDSETLPVSETAPQIEEPVENKPLDTAAVDAPADTVAAPASEEPAKESASATETATTPKTEEKGGFLGFIKKQEAKFVGKKEHKEEKKEEQAAETTAKDPVVTDASTETPVAAESTPTTTEERPAREKRRPSLFSGLGTLKKKTAPETGSQEATSVEKREKSPLPAKLTGLFRRPSKASKPTEETAPATEGAEAAKPEAKTDAESAEPVAVTETTESTVAPVLDPVATATEVKASA